MPSFLQFWSVPYRDIAETLFLGGTTVTSSDSTQFTLTNGTYTVRVSGTNLSFDANGRMLTGEIDHYNTYEGDPSLGKAVMIADSNFTLLDRDTFNAAFDLARAGSMRAAVNLVMADWAQENYGHTNYSGGYMKGTIRGDNLFGGGPSDFIFGGLGEDVIVLGGGNDEGYGGDDRDWLYGGGGDDLIYGGAGDDNIWADDFGPAYIGDDEAYGGAGNDGLTGGRGRDSLYGGADNDFLNGERDNDVLNGGTGNDSIRGGAGLDTLTGGDGNDSLDGGIDNDRIDGGDGDDFAMGGQGDDRIDGGAGNDTLQGHAGVDGLFGGDGSDTLNGGLGSDELTGGLGADRFVISGADTQPFTDYITDFELDVDQIVFSGFGLTSLDELLALGVDTADGVLFALSSNRWVVVAGVEVSQLTNSDDLIVS